MLIEFCKDIAEDACNAKSRALQVLDYLLMAHRLGKHLIFFPHEVVSILVNSELNASIRRECISIGKQTSTIGAFSHRISIKLVVTQNEYTPEENQKVIQFNPYYNNSFELYEETHLLTENLLDADFYLALVSYYKRKAKVNSVNVCFFPLQGGGDTVNLVMEKEITLGHHLCIAIVDSDMKYQGCVQGNTCKQLVETLKRNKSPFCGIYCMHQVREIENLIPFHLICECTNYKNHKLIKENFDFDMSFFDMKEGIRLKNLSDVRFVDYWRAILGVHHRDYSKMIKKEVQNRSKKRKSKLIDNIVLDGFGSKLLPCIWEKGQNELMRIEDYQLTISQKKEWLGIGQAIFDWCCSGKSKN